MNYDFRLPEELVRMCRKCLGNERGVFLPADCAHSFIMRETWVGVSSIETAGVRSPKTAAGLMGESCLTEFYAARKLTGKEILELQSGTSELAIVVRRKLGA